MLHRLTEQLPDAHVQNRSLHLSTGTWDACYSGAVHFPDRHWLGFLVSFIVPYYIIYSARTVDDPEATEARRALASQVAPEPRRDTADVYVGNTMTVKRREAMTPEALAALEDQERRYREVFTGKTPFAPDWRQAEEEPCQPQMITFDFSEDEKPYAAWLAREIEASFGCEHMPPEVGNVIVPDVATNGREIGEARLYDCLFSDQW
jgi:hypothetical protein